MDRRPPTRNMQALDNLRKMKWKHKEYSEGSKNRRKNTTNSLNDSHERRNVCKSESDKENDLHQKSTPVGQTNDNAMKIASQIASKKEAPENPSSSTGSSSNMSHDLDQLLDQFDKARLNDLAKVETEIIEPKAEEATLYNNLKKAYQETNFPNMPAIASQSRSAEMDPRNGFPQSTMSYNSEIPAPQNLAYPLTFLHQAEEPAKTMPHAMPTLNRMEPRGTVSQPTFNSNSSVPYIAPGTQQDYGYSAQPPNEIREAEPAKPMSENSLNLHSQFSSALTISDARPNQDYSMPPRNPNVEVPPPSATNFSSNISPADPVFGVQQNRGYSSLSSVHMRENESAQSMSRPAMYLDARMPTNYSVSGSPPNQDARMSAPYSVSGSPPNQEYSTAAHNRLPEMPPYQRGPPPAMPPSGNRPSRFYPELHSNDTLDTEPARSMSPPARYINAQMHPSYSVTGMSHSQEYSMPTQIQLHEVQPIQRTSQLTPPDSMSTNFHSNIPSMEQRGMFLNQHMPPPSHSVSGVSDSQVYSVSPPNHLLEALPLQRMMQNPPPVSVSGILSHRVHTTVSSMEPIQSVSQPGVYQMAPSYTNARVPENEDFSMLPRGQLPEVQPVHRMLQRSPPDSVPGIPSHYDHPSVPRQPRMYLNSQTSPSYSGSEVPQNQEYSMLPDSHVPERQPAHRMSQIPPPDPVRGMQSIHVHSGIPNMKPMQSTSKPVVYRDSQVPQMSQQMYASPPSIGAPEMEFVKPNPPANYGSYISPPRSHPGVQRNRTYAPPPRQNRMFEEEHANSMSQVPADFRFNARSNYQMDEMRENHQYSPPPQMEPRTAIYQPPMNANSRFAPHLASDHPSQHQMQSTHVSNRTLEMAVAQFTCPANVDSYYHPVTGMPVNEMSSAERISPPTIQSNHTYSEPPANMTREMELAISLSQQAPMTFNSQISPPYSRSEIPRDLAPAQTRLPETDPNQLMPPPPMNFNSSMYHSATEFQDDRPPIRNQMHEMERNHVHDEHEMERNHMYDERAPTYVEQGPQFQDPTPFTYEDHHPRQDPTPFTYEDDRPRQDPTPFTYKDHRPRREPPPVRFVSKPPPVSSGQQYRLNRHPRPQSPVTATPKETPKEVSPTEPKEKPVELMPWIPGKIFVPRSRRRKEVSPETIEEWNNPKCRISWKEFGKMVKEVEKTYLPDYNDALNDDAKDCDAEEDCSQMPNSDEVASPIENTEEHSDAQQPSINGEQSLEEPQSSGVSFESVG